MMQLAMVCSCVWIKPQAPGTPSSASPCTTGHPGSSFHLAWTYPPGGAVGPSLVLASCTTPALDSTHISVDCSYSCHLRNSSMIFVCMNGMQHRVRHVADLGACLLPQWPCLVWTISGCHTYKDMYVDLPRNSGWRRPQTERAWFQFHTSNQAWNHSMKICGMVIQAIVDNY